jgi:hypothetical protein
MWAQSAVSVCDDEHVDRELLLLPVGLETKSIFQQRSDERSNCFRSWGPPTSVLAVMSNRSEG